MILSAAEFLSLVNQDDELSRHRLRTDDACESVWEDIIAKHPELKRSVTLNGALPDRILRLLASDPDPLVRSDIANKRALPADLFALLAEDSNETVRARISWNKKTPSDILQKLAADSSPIVAEQARNRTAKK